jgi:nicotinate dehydrogenase FAD-subunit
MNLKKVFNPKNVREVIELLAKYGSESKLIAGGTDIVIELKNEKISPIVLIDIWKINEIKKIEDDGEFIKIGSGVTFTQIVESDLFKDNLRGFNKACRMVGSPQIRNKGTIGGNIANGAAAADAAPPLICLESTIILESLEGIRQISLEEYYKHPIKDNEILTYIRFRKPNKEKRLAFAKLGLRKALAISRLTNSVLIELDDEKNIKLARVASGALAKTPVREYDVENYLLGKKINDYTIKGATEVLRESMEKRLKGRSTLPYKSEAIKTTVREALEDVLI